MNGRLRYTARLIAGAMVAFSLTALPALAFTETYITFGPSAMEGGELKTGVTSAKPDWLAVTSYKLNPGGKDGVVPGSAAGVASKKDGGKAASMDVVLAPGVGSQTIFEMATKASAIPNVRLEVLNRGPKGGLVPLETVLMSGVVITSVEWTGSKSDKPATSVTFNYDKIEIEQNTKAPIGDPVSPTAWNLVKNLQP
jgi:type VI protein secretion system component Hcp